jgi:hypothetical protein
MAREETSEIVAYGVGRQAGLPAVIRGAGKKAQRRFAEFFAAQIRNRNTREAYHRAVVDFFAWCEDRGLG